MSPIAFMGGEGGPNWMPKYRLKYLSHVDLGKSLWCRQGALGMGKVDPDSLCSQFFLGPMRYFPIRISRAADRWRARNSWSPPSSEAARMRR